MTFAECIPLLLEGKKIKRPIFGLYDYIDLDADDNRTLTIYEYTKELHFLMDIHTYELKGSDLTATDWEEVKE